MMIRKYLILFSFLVLSFGAIAASWKDLPSGQQYDAESLRKDGDKIVVWERGFINEKSYAQTLLEYDCSKRGMRMLEAHLVNSETGKGRRLATSDLGEFAQFGYPGPDSNYSMHMGIHCKKWYQR